MFLAGSAAAPFLSYASLTAVYADTPKDVLVVAQQLDNMTSLDPHESFEAVGSEICGNIYQKLVTPNLDKPDAIDGDLAESWSAAEDGKTFTFRLRKDAKFASGAPVTADDAAFSLQRAVIMNKGPAFIISQFGFTKDNVAERIKALDPATLVITTAEPTSLSFLLYCLSAGVGAIVEKKVALERAQGEDLGNGWLRQNSAGSGPWTLRAWKPSESVMLDANPHGGRGSNVKRIVLRHIVDPSAQLLMLQKGDVDIARDLTTDQLRALEGNASYNLVRKSVAGLMVISMNQKHPHLAKPQVWQAIKWAIDYDGIQKNVVPLTFVVQQSFLPAGFPGALTEKPFRKDVARAKALMAEAGLADGFEVTMDHYSAQPYPDIAQTIQANLGEIGIRVKLLSAENRQVLTKTRARQHELALTVWGTDYFDPHANADVFCVNLDNSDDAKVRPLTWRSSWQDKKMSDQALAALKERDPARRVALYEQLQRDHMAASPFAFLLQKTTTAACRKGVTGARLGTLSDSHSYATVRKS
ncbi:ABC transporter substrate-binding protein [Chelatococcus sp. SYSU_G07232]|uniref:ABC transporter substrate-binding protein n=2 Tax=Chelatococcus albus TaxID=3047466 RepID=A0ABT7ALH1_9HYPH|nr:ABC transporter substrate-binding protein [Chelatococcus sp. SYSU_G07232]MDJ1160230.1 ABC transporter substrate-binding protein [Chelatococcus sp. SYSU_G07232]